MPGLYVCLVSHTQWHLQGWRERLSCVLSHHFKQLPCLVFKCRRALQVVISRVADLHFDSSTSYSSQTTVLSAVCSSRPQLWIHITRGKLNLQSRRGPKCWYLQGKVTGSFSEKKKITWKIIMISVHKIRVGGSLHTGYQSRGYLKTEWELILVFQSPVLYSSTCQSFHFG